MKKWTKPTIRGIPTHGLIPLWSDRRHPIMLLRSLIIEADDMELTTRIQSMGLKVQKVMLGMNKLRLLREHRADIKIIQEPTVEPCSHKTPCGRPAWWHQKMW